MTDHDLVERAMEAQQLAYVPYSHYRVGAALLTCSGKVYTGCNIENASYGLTICAERTALFKAVSEGERDFASIAVVVDGEAFASPCGACRQVLAEFAPNMRCILANGRGEHKVTTVADLLPDGFGASNMPSARHL
ncbi:MAG: cytidine deaminase [Bacillota bacterium]